MESIALAARVVTPLFLLMAAGFTARQFRVIPAEGFSHLNTLCFKLFLPALLFSNIEGANLAAAFSPRLMLFVSAAQVATMGIALIAAPRLLPDAAQAASCAQGMFRSNFVAMGIALVSGLMDADGIGMVSLLGAATVPLFNICSVVILETLRGEKARARSFARNLATNPLIIASALGVACLLLGVHPAGVLKKTIGDIARAATPVTIMCLGGLFNLASIRRCLKAVLLGTAGRLMVMPALALGAAAALGLRGAEFLAVSAVFTAPTAAASFAMAKQLGADCDTAALIIVATTACSLVTMAFWLALTHSLRLW